jgi:hypothetical protein
MAGRLHHLHPVRRPSPGRRAATVRAGRGRRPPGAYLVGWHAPPPGPGRQPGRPPRVLFLDEPIPGGSRPARRPDRRHRPRPRPPHGPSRPAGRPDPGRHRTQHLRGAADGRSRLRRRLPLPRRPGRRAGRPRPAPDRRLPAVVDLGPDRPDGAGPRDAGTASLLPVIPLAFTSSTFVPVATMPGWLQTWGEQQSHHRRGRHPRPGPRRPTSGPLLKAIAWILGILAVVIPLAIHRYRRVTQ